MTVPGRYSSDDGGFAKSASSAAARGGILIAAAVLIGLVILAWGYDSGDESAADAGDATDGATTTVPTDTTPDEGGDDGGDDAAADDATPDDTAADDTGTTVPATPDTRPPGEVKVAVANGVGVDGLAGTVTDTLITAGFVAEAGNSTTSPLPTSQILYAEGYSADAGGVAAAISAPASIIAAAPADPATLTDIAEGGTFNVWVLQGEDRLAG